MPRVRNNYSTFDHWSRYWLKLQGPDIKVHEEYIVYDFNSFIADVGGYMGLLLGFSILGLYDEFQKVLRELNFFSMIK